MSVSTALWPLPARSWRRCPKRWWRRRRRRRRGERNGGRIEYGWSSYAYDTFKQTTLFWPVGLARIVRCSVKRLKGFYCDIPLVLLCSTNTVFWKEVKSSRLLFCGFKEWSSWKCHLKLSPLSMTFFFDSCRWLYLSFCKSTTENKSPLRRPLIFF